MLLELKRLHDDGDTTIGAFYINGIFECFIVEDQHQTRKVYGETRIPEGEFNIGLRREGGFHNRYSRKFPDMHRGMLCVYNQPNWKIKVGDIVFQYVLIHIGNDDDDTAGCLLPNMTIDSGLMRGGASTVAYKKIYPKIIKALLDGEKVTIKITNEESGT